MTPEQLAAAIAGPKDVTKPATGDRSPLALDIDANGAVGETRHTVKDTPAFADAAAHREDLESGSLRNMCKTERGAYIKRGVMFRDVFVSPDAAHSISFIIDERSCVALAVPAALDTEIVRKSAADVARELTKALSGKQLVAGSRFEKATANDDIVVITNTILTAASVDFFKLKEAEIRGKTEGILCQKFTYAIQEGVRIRVIYELGAGQPIIDFAVDNALC